MGDLYLGDLMMNQNKYGVKYKLYRGQVFSLSTPRVDIKLLTQRHNSAPKVYVSYATMFP